MEEPTLVNGFWFSKNKLTWREILDFVRSKEVCSSYPIIPHVFPEGQIFQCYGKDVFGAKCLFDDNLCWYFNKNGVRVKPQNPKTEKYGKTRVKRTISKHKSGNLIKMFIKNDDNVIIIYESTVEQKYDSLEKKKKSNAQEIEIIQNALQFRKVKDAHKHLKKEGFEISLRKIEHQAKNVPTSIKSLKGPVPLNVPESLANYVTKVECGRFEIDSESGVWRFMECNKKNIQLFVRNLSKKMHIENFREDLKLLDSPDDFEDTKATLFPQFKQGYHKKTCIMLSDTTFKYGNFNLTIVVGITPHFKTSRSKKPRAIILGYLLHQSKERSEHAAFARFLSSVMDEADETKDRAVSAYITDSETALEEYLKYSEVMQNAKHLKCLVHYRQNFERELNGLYTETMINNIFGKKKLLENGEVLLENCLLSSLNRQEFDDRLRVLEEECPPKVFSWLSSRSHKLYSFFSMRAKLEGMIAVHYGSSNIIESLNSVLKTEVNLNAAAVDVCKQLSAYCESEYDHFAKSVYIYDPTNPVQYFKNKKDVEHTDSENIDRLLNAGFTECDLIFYEIPFKIRNLLPKEMRDSPLSGLAKISCDRVSDKFYVRQNNVSICVEKHGDNWICDNCSKQKSNIGCIHLIKASCGMKRKERRELLKAIEKLLDDESIQSKIRRERTTMYGQKSNRKFSKFSAHNKPREVHHVGKVSKNPELVADNRYLGINELFENDEESANENMVGLIQESEIFDDLDVDSTEKVTNESASDIIDEEEEDGVQAVRRFSNTSENGNNFQNVDLDSVPKSFVDIRLEAITAIKEVLLANDFEDVESILRQNRLNEIPSKKEEITSFSAKIIFNGAWKCPKCYNCFEKTGSQYRMCDSCDQYVYFSNVNIKIPYSFPHRDQILKIIRKFFDDDESEDESYDATSQDDTGKKVHSTHKVATKKSLAKQNKKRGMEKDPIIDAPTKKMCLRSSQKYDL